jgi:hypothetical protein
MSLSPTLGYLHRAYDEDPQDVAGLTRALDSIEAQGFWFTTGGLECRPCWRAGKQAVTFSTAREAEKHAAGHSADARLLKTA